MVSLSPLNTPRSLRGLLLITIALSLLSPLVFPYLALSLRGIQHFYYWQPLTYFLLFLPPLDFSFLLHLAFNSFLLWAFGASLLERSKPPLFYSLYFSSGLVGGLCALGAMALFSLPHFFAGNSPALYAILITWVFLNPEAQLLLFFTFPFKARWLLLGLIGANLLIDLSNGDAVSLFALSGATVYAYFFTLIGWRVKSPFHFLHPFEAKFLRLFERKKSSNIYDIRSGNPILDDDAFMDAMLTRISQKGENSLSSEEKKRMQDISRRKRK